VGTFLGPHPKAKTGAHCGLGCIYDLFASLPIPGFHTAVGSVSESCLSISAKTLAKVVLNLDAFPKGRQLVRPLYNKPSESGPLGQSRAQANYSHLGPSAVEKKGRKHSESARGRRNLAWKIKLERES